MRFFLLGLLYLCGLSLLKAQQCAPDPGPAIFLEDFGSGPNPGPALPLGTIGYIYGSINPGSYVVSNNSGLNDWLWHDGDDRTEGDTDGYMLLINAESEGAILYQKTFTDLCPNTTYIFSCHIANLMVPTSCIGSPEPPHVQFTVIDPNDNTPLFSTTSGQLLVRSNLAWRERNIQFSTGPDQTSLLIQLTNIAPGRCGNDLAIDDISLRLCNVQRAQNFDLCNLPDGSLSVGSSIYTEPGVYLDALPVPNSCNDTLITTTLSGDQRLFPTLRYTFCQGDTLKIANRSLTASANFVDTLPGPDPNCSLYQPYEIIAQAPQIVTQDITLCRGDSLRVGNKWYTNAGTYVDSLSTPTGCDSVVVTTIETAEIEVNISPPTIVVELGQSVQLMSSVSLSPTYNLSWQPPVGLSCLDCLDPLLKPQSSGTYQLVATDIPSSCNDTASLQVTVLSCEDVFIPNAFSPNFDRVNDQLELFTEDCFIRLLSWRIFDRWGGQVYETTEKELVDNTFTAWDGYVKGQPAEQGIYSYQLILERNNGTLKEVRGEVILLR